MCPRFGFFNVPCPLSLVLIFQADPPDPSKIPEGDIVGVTVLLLTCSYRGQEFIRVGYYVNNEYIDEELREEPPARVQLDKLQRVILADKPRVTKFPINFDQDKEEEAPQQKVESDVVRADDSMQLEGDRGHDMMQE